MSKTYQPNRRKRAKTHGFLTRAKTPGGKKVNLARRRKGRADVAIKK